MPQDQSPKQAVRLLSDVKVPQRFYSRHQTGFEVLDQAFGGSEVPGVLPGGSYLTTGLAGSGKTTLLLQMMDAYAKTGLKVVLNIGEESPYQVKMVADRINIKGDFELTTFDDVNELMVYAIDAKTDILCQDSLQSLLDAEYPYMHSDRLWLAMGKKLNDAAKDFVMTTFIVNHVTKSGEMRGKNELVHDVDAHIHLSLNRDTGNRILELRKNRFGPAQMPYEFTLTRDGMNLVQRPEGVDAESTRNSQRRERVLAVIRELLLSGRPLSGYSHEEEPEIMALQISGGGMRGYLRMAERELREQGSVFIRETVNRRETIRIDISA